MIRHDVPRFSMVIPRGFQQVSPELLPRNGLYGFVERKAASGSAPDVLTIAVQGMGGVFTPEAKLDLNALKRTSPPGAAIEKEKVAALALGTELEAVVTHLALQGRSMFSIAFQIPLKGEAIQVIFMGPSNRESDLRRVFRETAASIEGEVVEGSRGSLEQPPSEGQGGGEGKTEETLGVIVGGLFGLIGVIIVVIVIRRMKG